MRAYKGLSPVADPITNHLISWHKKKKKSVFGSSFARAGSRNEFVPFQLARTSQHSQLTTSTTVPSGRTWDV